MVKSIEDILMELTKLRAVKVGGKWRLTEISKKQRTILEKMKIGVSIDTNLVHRSSVKRRIAMRQRSR
jgi:hypothetical protein